MDPDVFITIVLAGLVGVLSFLGAWIGIRSARSERATQAPRNR